MIYIGIDPSFTRTCYCIFNEQEHIHTFSLEFDSKKKTYKFKLDKKNYGIDGKTYFKSDLDRLHIAYQTIPLITYEISKEFPREDVHIAIEEPMGLHAGAGAKIDRIFAAFYLSCIHTQEQNELAPGSEGDIISITTFKPSQIKKFLTGKGNSKKEDMKLWAFKKFGFEAETNDEIDAYAIARLLYSTQNPS